jgi:hypothetical protein
MLIRGYVGDIDIWEVEEVVQKLMGVGIDLKERVGR